MAGYSQNDPRWSGDKLGTSTYWTMGAAGCFVTAGADVLRAFGHDITPGDLNRLATSQGLINSNGDVTRPDWLSVLFPDVCKFVEQKDWGSALADLHYFDIRNDLNTEIILEIDDSPAVGMQTHFMRTVGWDGGNDVVVDDSWDAIRKGVNAYGARWNPPVHAASIIYKAVKYIKVATAAPDPNITLDQLTQLYQDILKRPPDQAGVDHYAGHYTYNFVKNDLLNSREYKDLTAPQPDPVPTITNPVSTVTITNPPPFPAETTSPPVQSVEPIVPAGHGSALPNPVTTSVKKWGFLNFLYRLLKTIGIIV